MDPGDELVEVVDESDRVVEVVPRRAMRDRRLLHRCTYIVVLNGAGELYVHRRTQTKDVNPGFYDVSAGGVNAAGADHRERGSAEMTLEQPLQMTRRDAHGASHFSSLVVTLGG